MVRFEVTHHLFGLKKIHAIEFYHLIYLPCIFWRGKQNLSRDLWVNLGKNHVSRKTCPTYLGENIHRAWNRRSCIAQKQICWSFQQETPRWMSRINFHQKFPPQTSWMFFFFIFLLNKNGGEGRSAVFFQQLHVDLNVNVTLDTVYIISISDIIHPVTCLRSHRIPKHHEPKKTLTTIMMEASQINLTPGVDFLMNFNSLRPEPNTAPRCWGFVAHIFDKHFSRVWWKSSKHPWKPPTKVFAFKFWC